MSLRCLGRYELIGLLATGGMAEIFLARIVGPSGFQRPVVLKRILPHLARTKAFTDMFVDEARIVAGIRHPNVVAVQELAQVDGELFLVMEYLEGESLGALLRRSTLLPEALDSALIAFIVAEACAGLHAAHELTDDEGFPRDLVHRDVSPQNLFVTYSGQVKVLDFGVAKAANRSTCTEGGQVKGKFAYMSPEQCLGRSLDRRSDVFALGIVLWEMCCLTRLFARESAHLTFKSICDDPIPRPSAVASSCPPELEEICMKALSRERSGRYENALAMRIELLVAARKLGLGETPEEDLSEEMKRRFAERIEQKQDMIRRVARGAMTADVPVAEPEDSELPSLAGELSTASGSMEVRVPKTAQRSRSRLSLLSGAATLATLAVVWFVLREKSQETVGAEAPARSAAVDVARSAPPAVASNTVRPLSETITLEIQTTPSGALVVVAGKARGNTPIAVELPRTTSSLPVEISRAGFVTRTEQIVPNMNQRLVLPLSSKPLPRTARLRPQPKEIPRFR